MPYVDCRTGGLPEGVSHPRHLSIPLSDVLLVDAYGIDPRVRRALLTETTDDFQAILSHSKFRAPVYDNLMVPLLSTPRI